jgi:hypothetical protein
MQQLHAWLTHQLEDRLVEPNSSLAGAITYMLKHWKKLTLFLRVEQVVSCSSHQPYEVIVNTDIARELGVERSGWMEGWIGEG